MDTFKICLIGGPQTGKTAFIKRHLTGNFVFDYIPTMGVEVHQLVFKTNVGTYYLNIWDTAGQQQFEGLRDAYYIGSDAAVAFYNSEQIDSTNQFVKDFGRIREHAPIINVWNQCDQRKESEFVKKMSRGSYSTIRQGGRITYQVSAKSNYNYEKPFLEILRKLTQNPQLQFA